MEEKKTRKGTYETAVYPAVPKTIISINKQFITDFFNDKVKKGELTKAEVIDWRDTVNSLKEADSKSYFMKLRKAFVEKYYPALLKPVKSDTVDMVDFFDSLIAEM